MVLLFRSVSWFIFNGQAALYLMATQFQRSCRCKTNTPGLKERSDWFTVCLCLKRTKQIAVEWTRNAVLLEKPSRQQVSKTHQANVLDWHLREGAFKLIDVPRLWAEGTIISALWMPCCCGPVPVLQLHVSYAVWLHSSENGMVFGTNDRVVCMHQKTWAAMIWNWMRLGAFVWKQEMKGD